MINVGDILSTVGVFSTVGDIMSTVGVTQYLKYCGGYSVPWGYHDAHGGYHEYCEGCSVPWGYHPLKFEYHGGYHDTCEGYHEYHGSVQYRGVLK